MFAPWNDSQPIYRQLKTRLIAQILDGELSDGDALPSVRTVATDGNINPLTVSKAYQELVDEALIESRRGLGMFVLPGARARLIDSERRRFLDEEWPQVLARILRLGLDPHTLLSKRPAQGSHL